MPTPELTFHRDRCTWLAYLLLAVYGYFLNILGPTIPFLKAELGLSYTVSSLHFTAFATGILLVGLGSRPVIDRLGRGRSLWTGTFGLALGAILLATGRSAVATISGAFVMGTIGSLILVLVPSILSDRHGELRAVAFAEANVVASLVATAAPLLIGASARLLGSWSVALAAAAAAPLLLWAFFAKIALPPAAPMPPGPGGRRLPPRFWAYWAAIVLAVSAEFCMISWSADFLERRQGMAKADAAQALSLFLAAMIVGRLAGSRLVRGTSPHRLVDLSVLAAGAGFGLFWVGRSAVVSMGGLFLTGLGIASLYPLLLSLAMHTAGANTIQASARATLASGAAILALPLVLGRLADAVGIHPAYGIVLVLLAGVFGVTRGAGSAEPRAARPAD